MRYRQITILVLACVAFASTAAAETMDLTTGTAARETVSAGWLPRDDGNVLWDLTHGVYLGYEPAVWYADLAALLAANGHVVTTTSAGLDNVDLSLYDVIVICLGSAWNSPYTASEVAAVLDFIGDGGGVLVLADNTACPNANINPITEAVGTSCGVADAQDAVSNFAAHPVFSGVNSLHLIAAGQVDAGPPSQLLAWDVGGSPVIAALDPCGLAVVGDINFCAEALLEADNSAFALNVVDWLSVCTVESRTETWGNLKAMFR